MRKFSLALTLGLTAPAWASDYGELSRALLMVSGVAIGVPLLTAATCCIDLVGARSSWWAFFLTWGFGAFTGVAGAVLLPIIPDTISKLSGDSLALRGILCSIYFGLVTLAFFKLFDRILVKPGGDPSDAE